MNFLSCLVKNKFEGKTMNYKRINTLFILVILIISLSISAFADAEAEILPLSQNTVSVTMALNEKTAVANGTQVEITPPVMVFDKTYVDLYAIGALLNIGVHWIEDSVGYFKVTANNNTVDFTVISQWDDLLNQNYKFFVKDEKIFVSLRELAELANLDVTYNNGIITIGNPNASHNKIYNNISEHDFNDYVYTKYPTWAQYVVNPYQKYGYETMINDANRLQYMYPELIKTSSIGKSVENRDLLLIEFGRGKDKIFVCATHHAREYIATTYLMYAIDRYAYAYRNNSMWGKYNPKEILDNITFCIVPMVNPDGVNLVQNGIYSTQHANEILNMSLNEGTKYGYLSWKANVNGVDVNWNYDKDWSIEKNKKPRGSAGFNGDYPNSEPETGAVSRYVDNNSFEAYLSFHTQGEVLYWADNPENPTCLYQAIRNDTGFTGYEEKADGIGGSFFDYVYRKFKKPSVTVELCPYIGNYPYPDKDFNTVWKPTKNILLVAGNEIIYRKSIN